MKRVYKLTILVVIAILLFVVYTFYSTGYFRSIESKFEGTVAKKIDIPGVEDMQISPSEDFMILSSDDRAGRRDGNTKQGALYYMSLGSTDFEPINLTKELSFEFYPHGISIVEVAMDSYLIYAINHVNDIHSIEVFELENRVLTHVETIKDEALVSPNDLVALGNNTYYFTNDHKYTKGLKRLAEDYLGLARSNVVYFNGSEFSEVASGIAYANGIAFDRNRNLIFVASPRAFLIKVYEVEKNGNLKFIEDISCGTGVDNIEIQRDGSLLIGCHPSLLTFTSYAQGKIDKAPSEVISINYKGKNDYEVSSIFLDDGSLISATTVATSFENHLFIGNVMDDHFVILNRSIPSN